MAQKIIVTEKKRTKESNLVVPLDEVRTIDFNFVSITSGTFDTSGVLYTVASGKEAYLKQVIATDTAGADGVLKIGKAVSGGFSQILTIPVYSGQMVTVNTMLGPVMSGFAVMSGTPFGGDVTVVVQVDPRGIESGGPATEDPK